MGPLIVFSKFFKEKSVEELVETARGLGIDGYDLCVRPGYVVSPDNAGAALPAAAGRLRGAGLDIPMVTGNFDLLLPDHPTAEPLLAAMDRSDVRLLKLGYFGFDPVQQDYWAEVERIRRAFEGWQELARRHRVRICYHTHSMRCMGLNAGTLAHLVRGFDPECIGAYLDPGHLVIEGEEFAVAAAIVKERLAIVAVKDVLLTREEAGGHGRKKALFVEAGRGMVDWTAVFADLARIAFSGPISIHCEFETAPEDFLPAVRREVSFFREMTGGPKRR